jgi:hypothetical protein
VGVTAPDGDIPFFAEEVDGLGEFSQQKHLVNPRKTHGYGEDRDR